MIPGPNYIIKCPYCSNLLSKRSLRSGNTIGSKLYSDTKRISPMLPDFPAITKCEKCQNIFWINEAEEIGNYEFSVPSNKQDWEKAQRVTFLSYQEYYSVLKTKLIRSKADEIFIRIRILWEYNDSYRKGRTSHQSNEGKLKKTENIEALIALLDKNDVNQKLLIAELYRNLGNFDEAINLLNTIDNDKLNSIKERMIEECKKQNTLVFQLK
jgi:hypothetical protein